MRLAYRVRKICSFRWTLLSMIPFKVLKHESTHILTTRLTNQRKYFSFFTFVCNYSPWTNLISCRHFIYNTSLIFTVTNYKYLYSYMGYIRVYENSLFRIKFHHTYFTRTKNNFYNYLYTDIYVHIKSIRLSNTVL